ncbi:N-acetylglutaminylglutamine amidotransferase [Cohaesibacter celericrescens]|uniref:asparagine synthase (glutamine-hydrolyzing) n=1 Tax=Cohaesibacter celericrescens TaxID=2067669 RepID=A0A2N5XUZ4_9HYPH|nr:N-acetylglutaminylglutamine amidotransferase [Cohaesibacter celericrescens]PLW78265.1 N-acetylglutaminylglutamine amidotransferase [Cohaesibacter celericrescens]
MCGICGEVTFNGTPVSAEKINAMTERLSSRGPDASGTFIKGNVGMGHRRLKIIDLSDASAQPFIDKSTGLTIVFNGCIYNYPELRQELTGLGHKFASNGDTEVILKAWAEWGQDALPRLQGMFAFVIHEENSGRIIMVRDRFGIKPLYLNESHNHIRFASTLQAILAGGDVDRSIDRAALHHFMSWHAVVPAPRTILKGVRKLPAATVRIIEADGTSTERQYWTPSFESSSADQGRSESEWCDLLLDKLREAVKRRMVCDVPVGVLLSGGVDSSLIVGLLAEQGQSGLATYSIGFEDANDEKGNEFEYSDLIAQHYGTNHHKIHIPSDEMMENLPSAIAAMSEPMVSYDNIGFYLLSREVSKSIKVVQSGQGADEVFGGYHWYPPLQGSPSPLETYVASFFDRSHKAISHQLNPDYHADRNESLAFVAEHFGRPGAEDAVAKALRLDTNVMLVDDPVKRVDNMTMAWGLEARVPFLDHEVVELAGRIPSQLKLAHGGKGILKETARHVVPAAVIDRPKGYFPVPALKYIQGPYLQMVKDALSSQAAKDRGLFQQDYLDQLFAAPSDHITPLRGSELWQVALLELWLQTLEA